MTLFITLTISGVAASGGSDRQLCSTEKYRLVVNKESIDSNNQYYTEGSTYIPWGGKIDAKFSHKRRRICIMVIAEEDYRQFLTPAGLLPHGTHINENFAAWSIKILLTELANKAELPTHAKLVGISQPSKGMILYLTSTTGAQPKICLEASVSLSKEPKDNNADDLLEELKNWIHETVKQHDGINHRDSVTSMQHVPHISRNRQGAMKRMKRIEFKNHRFLLHFFNQPSSCSVCKRFIYGVLQAQAYKCSHCFRSAHEDCINKVFESCKSNPNSNVAGAELTSTSRLGINIPHNWVNSSNIRPRYCCHCGEMITMMVNKMKGLTCSCCSRKCHLHCRKFVANDCGMDTLELQRMIDEINIKKQTETNSIPEGQVNEGMYGRFIPQDEYVKLDEYEEVLYHSLSMAKAPSQILSKIPPRPTQIPPLGLPTKPVPPRRQDSRPSTTPPPVPARPTSTSSVASHQPQRRVHKSPKFSDYIRLKVLGQGSFGKVFLARHQDSNQLVAIKALRKDVTIESNDVAATITERDILKLGSLTNECGFLAGLVCSFQSAERLYFVMEFYMGGDLMFHVQKQKRFGVPVSRHYGCETAMALEFLHSKKIVYRDLKLDNVLLDNDGRCKLADFGMCKMNVSEQNKCSTFCGTPDYLAPEIVLQRLYTFSVDWWSFGVLLYEMIYGRSPFQGSPGASEEVLYRNIKEKVLTFRDLDEAAMDFMNKIFIRDPTQRLGVNGSVLRHPFFTQYLDVEGVREKRVQPPLRVAAAGSDNEAVRYFDTEFTDAGTQLSVCDRRLHATEQQFFCEFDFIHPELMTKYTTNKVLSH